MSKEPDAAPTRSDVRSMVVPSSAAALDRSLPDLPFDLLCPFDSGINEHANAVQTGSEQWAQDVGLIESARARHRLAQARVGWLVSFVFREAPEDALQLAADWTTLFCMLDDRLESQRSSPLGLSDHMTRILALFRGADHEPEDAIARAFADLRERMLRLAGAAWHRRFGIELEELFTAFVWEAINRAKLTRPTYTGHRTMRAITVGLRPEFLLGELAEDIRLPAAARTSEELRILEHITCRAVGWANDIFTHQKELRTGEFHNVVLVLMEAESLPTALALQRAAAIHDEEVRAFLSARARLQAAAGGDREVERYADMLAHWIRGHLDWARLTQRYRPDTRVPGDVQAPRAAAHE